MISQYPFGAYIVSYLPDRPKIRKERRDDLVVVLVWWMTKTSIPITLIAFNWQASDFALLKFSIDVAKLNIIEQPGRPLIHNRTTGLEAFYDSDHEWGIMLDDDAVLYDGPQHNRGPGLFPEMIANGIKAYQEIDVFFPINPQKIGFSPIYKAAPSLYAAHHVFERSIDLKGSMFVVRNFRKEGKSVVLPDPTFTLHGEDRYFALEAVKNGYSVMRCENIVLKELSGTSHFGTERVAQMKTGYTKLAQMYDSNGLKMRPDSHQHDLKEFWKNCWGSKPTRVVV